MVFKESLVVFDGYIWVFLLLLYSNNFITDIFIIFIGCLKILYNPNEFLRIFEEIDGF